MIPASSLFDQSTMPALLEHDPIVQDYRAFFLCSIGLSSTRGNSNDHLADDRWRTQPAPISKHFFSVFAKD